MTITEFLTARLDEAERYARDEPEGWNEYDPSDPIAPDRLLADIAAKRQIIARVMDTVPPWADAYQQAIYETLMEDVLPPLASVYSDHPDYREEWKP